jgi:hypothetical protein
MLSLNEKIGNGLKIFKDKFLIFVILALISSILSIVFAPGIVKNNIPESDIETQLSISFGGVGSITATDVVNSLIWMLQFTILATALLIVAYVAKKAIDNRIFAINRLRDWSFFIVMSGMTALEVYAWSGINSFIGLNYQNDLIANLITTFILVFITVILTAALFDPELKRENPITISNELNDDLRFDYLDKTEDLDNNQNINNPQTAGDQISPAEDQIIKQ